MYNVFIVKVYVQCIFFSADLSASSDGLLRNTPSLHILSFSCVTRWCLSVSMIASYIASDASVSPDVNVKLSCNDNRGKDHLLMSNSSLFTFTYLDLHCTSMHTHTHCGSYLVYFKSCPYSWYYNLLYTVNINKYPFIFLTIRTSITKKHAIKPMHEVIAKNKNN